MNRSTQKAKSKPSPLVLNVNGRSFVPFGKPAEGTIDGFYQRKPNGILLFDESRQPFVFVVANARQGYFFVSCSRHGKDIRYMHSTTSTDEKRLGLDTLGYAAGRALAESLPEQLDRSQTSQQAKAGSSPANALPAGWTESQPGGLATNVDPVQGGIIDQAFVSKDWFIIFHRDDLGQMDGFATREAAFEAFHKAVGTPQAA